MLTEAVHLTFALVEHIRSHHPRRHIAIGKDAVVAESTTVQNGRKER
jgi:hypothetical protein